MIESILLVVVSGIQAYIVRRLDSQDKLLDAMRVDLEILKRSANKRSTDV